MRDSFTRPSAWRFLIVGGLVLLGVRVLARRGNAPLPSAERAWPQRARRFYDLLAMLAPHWPHLRAAWANAYAASPANDDSVRLDEARRVLGVAAGATRDEINLAYRERMRRYHPDQGGSADMASRINAARDALLAAS